MKLGELFQRLGTIGSGWKNDDSLDDFETRNKGLRSLRRQKRALVDDPRERAYLERSIKAELRRRDREYFRGGSIMKQKNFMSSLPKKRQVRVTRDTARFLR